MKPTASLINCTNYFVSEMSLSASATYNPEKDSDLELEDLQVESEISTIEAEERLWAVALSVQQNVPPEKNAPYNFVVRLVGFFTMVEGVPKERTEQLLLTNGSSILFAAAREILRDMTSKGPYSPLLLPTLSFFPLSKETASHTPEVQTAEPKIKVAG